MRIGAPASREPSVTENIDAALACGDHIRHLCLLLCQRSYLRAVDRAMPICELCHPNGFVVLPQTVQLTRQPIVVPMERQVIDLRIAAAVRRAVSGVESVQPRYGILIAGHVAPSDSWPHHLYAGLNGNRFVSRLQLYPQLTPGESPARSAGAARS